MKKSNEKKLTLSTVTVRELQHRLKPEQLKAVVGGGGCTATSVMGTC